MSNWIAYIASHIMTINIITKLDRIMLHMPDKFYIPGIVFTHLIALLTLTNQCVNNLVMSFNYDISLFRIQFVDSTFLLIDCGKYHWEYFTLDYYLAAHKPHSHPCYDHNHEPRRLCANTLPDCPLTPSNIHHRDGCSRSLGRTELLLVRSKLHWSPAFCRQLWLRSDPSHHHRRFPIHRRRKPQLCPQPSYFLQPDEHPHHLERSIKLWWLMTAMSRHLVHVRGMDKVRQ